LIELLDKYDRDNGLEWSGESGKFLINFLSRNIKFG